KNNFGRVYVQNTTTVITTIITVLGTLGGVVLGVLLSNRFVARHEKAKQNTTVIQEVYMLLTTINSSIIENIEFGKRCLEGKELQDKLSHAQALIYLYLPSLKEKFDVLMKS